MEDINVKIILPKKWIDNVKYELLDRQVINGYEIPKGFTTDGATVPRVFWVLFPPVGKYLKAAILHDWMLDSNYGWKIANKEFNSMLKKLDIAWWRRMLMVGSVKIYGGFCTLVNKLKKLK